MEQDRRIDVALVIGAEHGGAVAGDVFAACHPEPDPAQREAETHARMAEDVENIFPSEQDGQKHARRRDDQNVEGDPDVRGHGTESRNEHAAR